MAWAFPVDRAQGGPGSWTVDQGVDIMAPDHATLRAVADGVIIGHGIGGFGSDTPILKLDDGSGYVYYGHAGPGGRVTDKTHVRAGQAIGEVGAGIVGSSTGPHLEIGFSNASGTAPIGPKGNPTAYRTRDLLLGATQTKTPGTGTPGGGGGGIFGTGVGPNVGPDLNPVDAVKGVLGGLWDSIKSQAAYAGLATVVVLGGMALLALGLLHATHTRPTGAAA